MSTLINQIAALRTSLHDADANVPNSFSNVFNTFFDISEGPELLKVSEPIQDEIVHALLENVTRNHLRDPAFVLTAIQMAQHKPTKFVHGALFAGRIMGTFFYFPGDQQGLVAFNDGSAMTHYYRITTTILPAGGMPMPRPAGKQ